MLKIRHAAAEAEPMLPEIRACVAKNKNRRQYSRYCGALYLSYEIERKSVVHAQKKITTAESVVSLGNYPAMIYDVALRAV